VVPDDFTFEVTEPFDVQLLVQRGTEGRDKASIPFDLDYDLPEAYLLPAPPTPPVPALAPAGLADEDEGPLLWVTIWHMKPMAIGVTVAALLVTAIFFFQKQLTRRPRLLQIVRLGYLAFTLGRQLRNGIPLRAVR
jgi:NosR/NirI family nitrous oxide reductase transcriptional regulator